MADTSVFQVEMMDFANIQTGLKILLWSILKIRAPIIVGWAITNRCNLNCRYCSWPKKPTKEIDTEQAIKLVDQMIDAGTRHLVFSGGEPLLRDDLERIVDRCIEKGITLSLNSNGLLVPKNIELIKKLSTLQLSIDGPEEIHDKHRGRGAFSALEKATEVAKRHRVKISFNSTLTKHNVGHVKWLVDYAKTHGALVDFQPVSDVHAEQKVIKLLEPPHEQYTRAIEQINDLKKHGAPVANSLPCLLHLKKYPAPTKIKCSAGRLITRIDPEGFLFPCNQLRENKTWPNAIEQGFKQAFSNLPDVSCSHCWCSTTVELNLLYSLNLSAILNQGKT